MTKPMLMLDSFCEFLWNLLGLVATFAAFALLFAFFAMVMCPPLLLVVLWVVS